MVDFEEMQFAMLLPEPRQIALTSFSGLTSEALFAHAQETYIKFSSTLKFHECLTEYVTLWDSYLSGLVLFSFAKKVQ